jgi:cellulose biosynthesis protein BcsQ
MYPNSQYPASQAPQQPSQPAAQFAQPLPKASNSVAYQPRQQERVAPVLNYVTPSYTEPQNQQLTQNQTQNQPQSQAYAPNANRYPGPPSAFPPGSTAEEAPSTPRDQAANRWYALKSVFDPQPAPVEQVPVQPPARVPVLAVFSLAGGVGKTSLVASLGRALSSRGERVLLVDTAVYGLLPFFFGARDQRPGQLRTFNPPGASAEAPIQMVTLDPESPSAETQNPPINQDPNQRPNQNQFQAQNPAQNSAQNQEWLAQEIVRYSRGVNRILVDLPTASGATTRRVLSMGPTILVPVAPDMNSVVSVGAIESFFRHAGGNQNNHPGGKQILPYYILNQFDYSLPLHLDVREILREQIGDRLLPFALRRSPAVSEALAEGMTVMDYAPNATVAEDYMHLAEWVRSLSAPASQTYRGVRWSER